MTEITSRDIEEIKKNYEEAVNSFDFRKVKKCVDVLDWKWYTNGKVEVPEIGDMYDLTDRLFNNIIQGIERKLDFPIMNISTCGFTVEVCEDNHIEITFTVEKSEWYSDWEVEDESVK